MLIDRLVDQGQKLLGQRGSLLSLWQTIADNFYPERADFTIERTLGDEFAADLATGVPVMVRRDLGNAIAGLLRPTNKVWAHTRVDNWDSVTLESRAWLERADERQRLAMYHRPTNFSRATREADHDFAAFGQAVLQVTRNSLANGLLFRCWHLRDCAWSEGPDGDINTVFRKWKTHAINVVRMFPKTVHPEVRKRAEQDPFAVVELWHCEVPSDIAEEGMGNGRGLRVKSVYIDPTNKHELESVDIPEMSYIIPRWQTVSGSQYAYSPATVIALPDARTLQEMTLTLLEAGEKATTPPLIGVQEALRSDVNVMAGGITWVDREYDERLGEVLRPLTIDKSGIPLGMDMAASIRAQLTEAFYLNKLSLPPAGGADMTAYEAGQRVQEYIRQALPLFEPMEVEYNGPLCEKTFTILLNAGVFGRIEEIPQELQGQDVKFQFESPLHDAVERVQSQKYLEALTILSNAIGADPAAAHLLDAGKGAKDALLATGVPASWLRTDAQIRERLALEAQAQQQQALLEQMQQGANVAKTIGLTPTPAGTLGTPGQDISSV